MTTAPIGPLRMTLTEAQHLMTMWWDGTLFIPFVESESADITGPGHQPVEAFALAVTNYDRVAVGDDEVTATDPADVRWRWAIVEYDPGYEDDWRVKQVPAGTPGAMAITTVWGVR